MRWKLLLFFIFIYLWRCVVLCYYTVLVYMDEQFWMFAESLHKLCCWIVWFVADSSVFFFCWRPIFYADLVSSKKVFAFLCFSCIQRSASLVFTSSLILLSLLILWIICPLQTRAHAFWCLIAKSYTAQTFLSVSRPLSPFVALISLKEAVRRNVHEKVFDVKLKGSIVLDSDDDWEWE